jgi:hypothetical protein
MPIQLDLYKTRDLGLASFIIAKGNEVNHIEKEGRLTHFVFQGEFKCRNLEREYKFNGGTIEAKKFYDAIREAKRLIFAE